MRINYTYFNYSLQINSLTYICRNLKEVFLINNLWSEWKVYIQAKTFSFIMNEIACYQQKLCISLIESFYGEIYTCITVILNVFVRQLDTITLIWILQKSEDFYNLTVFKIMQNCMKYILKTNQSCWNYKSKRC